MLKRLIFTNLFLIVFAGMLIAQSTDTVHVPATLENGDPYFNSIVEVVVGDTNSAGEQLHSVYKLDRNQFYILNQAIELRNPVTIIADAPDADNPPPKVMSNINEDGGTTTGSLFITWADLTLKNLWLSGIDLGAVNHGWGTNGAVAVNDSFVTVRLDGIWCDYNSWSSFGTTQPHTNWYVNNFHARNEQNAGDQWTTFLFYVEGAGVVDTFIVTNSSYFQSNSCFLFPPPVVKYLEVNHCTFVNSYKWPFHKTQWLKAKFNNNIFLNAGALGLTQTEAESQDPDDLNFGLINVDTLFANSSDTVAPGPYTIPENQREIEARNNLWYYSSQLEDYYTSHDTVMHPVFMNSRTIAMFDNDAVWPGLVAENNWNQDPMFNDFPELSDAVDLLAQACADIRAGSTHGWDWDGDMATEPDFWRLLIQYPTAENFKSYAGLTGTDGLPIGDLSFWGITDVDDYGNTIVNGYTLTQNYPNPFNPSTKINFTVPEAGHFTLKVYNLLGQEVATIINGELTAGNHDVTFNAQNLASGLYIYKLSGSDVNLTKKMMLLK